MYRMFALLSCLFCLLSIKLLIVFECGLHIYLYMHNAHTYIVYIIIIIDMIVYVSVLWIFCSRYIIMLYFADIRAIVVCVRIYYYVIEIMEVQFSALSLCVCPSYQHTHQNGQKTNLTNEKMLRCSSFMCVCGV